MAQNHIQQCGCNAENKSQYVFEGGRRTRKEIKVAMLIHKMIKGDRQVLYNHVLTRASTFPMNVLLTWGKKYDEPLVVATTSGNPVEADIVYGKRFNIEPMHKDWKTNAFFLEKTRVTDPKRIETLLIPIAFAYVCFLVLENIKRKLMMFVNRQRVRIAW